MLPIALLSRIFLIKDPAPNKWLCPTNSSRDEGRSRSANGAAACKFDRPDFIRFVDTFWEPSTFRLETVDELISETPDVANSDRLVGTFVGTLEVWLKIGANLLFLSCSRWRWDEDKTDLSFSTFDDDPGSWHALSRCWLMVSSETKREQTGLRQDEQNQTYMNTMAYHVTEYCSQNRFVCK